MVLSNLHIFHGVQETALSVLEAVLPLTVLFALFQIFLLKLPRSYVIGILKGTLLASCGLLLFLQGVNIGFLPFGRLIGEALGSLSQKWLLIPFGLLLGFVTTWGEPAVRILAEQIEDASTGSIPRTPVLYAICLGVSFSVGLGMFRIAYGVPLLYILIPGYMLVIGSIWISDPDFLAIAVDAGGVATGPIANTFLLALALGVASSMGGQEPILHGLGLVALIALAPIISVLILGFIYRMPMRRKET